MLIPGHVLLQLLISYNLLAGTVQFTLSLVLVYRAHQVSRALFIVSDESFVLWLPVVLKVADGDGVVPIRRVRHSCWLLTAVLLLFFVGMWLLYLVIIATARFPEGLVDLFLVGGDLLSFVHRVLQR